MKFQHPLAAALGALALASSLAAQTEPWVVIRAARLFDSQHGVFIANAAVVVHGERIADAGAAGQVKIPPAPRKSIFTMPHCCRD